MERTATASLIAKGSRGCHGDGNIDVYRLQGNDAESEKENLQIRQVVRFEVRRPETPGGEPVIHALDFSEEAFINKDNLQRVALSSKKAR